MFKNAKVKKMFNDDDPKIVFYLESKKIDLLELFKDGEDLIEKSIKNHKNVIAETAIMYCENMNRVNLNNQSYLMTAILYDNFPMFQKLLETSLKLDMVDNNRESALFYTINQENQAYFDLLKTKEIDLKGYNIKGENTLIYSYIHNRKEISSYLLRNNVFVNHIDKDGNTVLHYAVNKHDLSFTLNLIDHGADAFIKNYNHETVLDIAKRLDMDTSIMNKIVEVVNHIFEEENDSKLLELLLEYEDTKDYSKFNIPFLIAVFSVKFNNKFIFEKIIRKTEILNHVDYRGKSLLMYCIEFGMIINARKIIYLDSELNLKDKENKTILFTVLEKLNEFDSGISSQEEYKLIFNELLERKVDVNCQDIDGNTVLMIAIINKQATIVERLIAYPFINLNLMNNDRKTALMIAYENKDMLTLQTLIQSGKAEINTVDNNQNSIILNSLLDDNIELFDILLKSGADLDIPYQDGLTLLMIAVGMQKKRFIAKIFEYPMFNVNLQDNSGLTALMHAIKNRNMKVVEALLKCGADVGIKDNKEDAAIFYALEIEDFEIAKLIRNHEEQNQQQELI